MSTAAVLGYRWALSDVQFKILCEDHRMGGLPRPFTFTSRIRYADDYEAEKAEVRARLRELADPDLPVLIGALAKPDIMFVAQMWNELEPTHPRARIRVHAVCRGDRAYVVVQRPGETMSHSGGFDIAEATPATVAPAVIGLLPAVDAGRGGEAAPVAFDPEEVPAGSGEPGCAAPGSASPRLDIGMLKVIQGHLGFRPPGITHVGLAWRDVAGDGRYVVRGPGQPVIGMDGAAMARWIEARMAEIMVRLQP